MASASRKLWRLNSKRTSNNVIATIIFLPRVRNLLHFDSHPDCAAPFQHCLGKFKEITEWQWGKDIFFISHLECTVKDISKALHIWFFILQLCIKSQILLTYFTKIFLFYITWKYQITSGFLTFSGDIKMKH